MLAVHLISADVESLYTNMQIDLILESIREIFQEFPVCELQKLKSEVRRKYADRPNRDTNQKVKKEIIPVVTHYDNFHARLNKRWCRVIRNNPVFESVRIISAYKRHKNLADLLVRGRLGRPNAVINPPSQDDEDQRVEAMLDVLIEVINRDNLSPHTPPRRKKLYLSSTNTRPSFHPPHFPPWE